MRSVHVGVDLPESSELFQSTFLRVEKCLELCELAIGYMLQAAYHHLA